MPLRRGPLVPGDFRYLEEYLDWKIGAEMRKTKVAGLSIAIADDRRILWAKGFGLADTAGAPATPDTLYRAGSVSKVLTATEVMRRAERADIELDGALAAQLPGFTVRSRFGGIERITIHSLLAHHSGLPSDLMNGMWATEPISLVKLQGLLTQESLVTAPQSKYTYSNLDYSLLGRLLEVRSGETFATAMRRGLLAPLGMARSTFGPAAEAGAGLAKGYRAGTEVPSIELRDLPAGSLISSASDLSRFMSFVLAQGRTVGGEQLLQPSTLQQMFTSQFQGLPLDFGHDMGLGWKIWGVQVPGMGPIAPETFIPKVAVAGLLSFTLPKLSIRFTTVEGRSFAVLGGLPEPFPFEKMPRSPLPPAWLHRAGRYRTTGDESIVFHEVRVEISDDVAIIAGAGNGEGGVVRAVEQDGEEVLPRSGRGGSRRPAGCPWRGARVRGASTRPLSRASRDEVPGCPEDSLEADGVAETRDHGGAAGNVTPKFVVAQRQQVSHDHRQPRIDGSLNFEKAALLYLDPDKGTVTLTVHADVTKGRLVNLQVVYPPEIRALMGDVTRLNDFFDNRTEVNPIAKPILATMEKGTRPKLSGGVRSRRRCSWRSTLQELCR